MSRESRVQQAAHDALVGADGDWGEAARELIRRAEQDQGLRDDLLRPFLDGAAWKAIRRAARSGGFPYKQAGSTPPREPSLEGLKALGRRNFEETEHKWREAGISEETLAEWRKALE